MRSLPRDDQVRGEGQHEHGPLEGQHEHGPLEGPVAMALTPRERDLQRSRERYASRKQAGLCPRCGLRSPYPGKQRCLECIARDAPSKRRS